MNRAIGLCAVLAAGCGTHTVLVAPGVPVRLAEPVEARVLVPAGSGRWVEGNAPVSIPAGWYVLPPPATLPTGK